MKVEPSCMVFSLFLTHLLIYVTCLSHWDLTWIPVARMVKNLPVMQKTWVQSLGWEDPLERNGNPLQYSYVEIPWTEERGMLQSMRLQRVRQTKQLIMQEAK